MTMTRPPEPEVGTIGDGSGDRAIEAPITNGDDHEAPTGRSTPRAEARIARRNHGAVLVAEVGDLES